ncbi:hypothetical protein [Streptomyces sp. NPDC017988]|uniref:hypothetical protein n=1 Tax=Streptomyces sp. NPDC017988 TaxID=3365025 RepID=UPI0037BA435D
MGTIGHIVSRHHPRFVVPDLHLGLGRDDNVYPVLGGPHRIDFWDKEFNRLGSIDDFTGNTTDGYFAPSAVEAAQSGARHGGPAHHPHRARRGATHPEDALAHLSATLGPSFFPAMLDPWASVQHPLGGNQGTQYIVARERAARATGRTVAVDRIKRAYYGETNAPYAR